MNKTAHTKSANVFLAVGDLLRNMRSLRGVGGGLGKVEHALTNPAAVGRRNALTNIGQAVAAPVLAPALGVMGVASKVDHAAKAHDPLRLLQMRSREAAVKGMSPTPVNRRHFVMDMLRGLLNPDVRQAAGALGTTAVRGVASLAEKMASMEKSAAKWDKLWRVGKLGVDSLKRLGMQDAVVPGTGGGYKAVQTAYREAAATNMPQRFARKAPDHNWAPSGRELGVKEFNEPGLISMQTQRRAANRSAYTGIPTEVSRRTSGPKKLSPGDRGVGSYHNVSQDPLNWAPQSRAELYTRDAQVPWSEAGGVNSYGIARTLGTSVESNRLPWVRPKARYSGHEGVIAHENGHTQQYADRHSGLMTDMINRRLLSTLPGGELLQPGTTSIDELAGHFNATKGMSFGNRAALKLPIYNAQNLSPGLPGQWAAQLGAENPRMSDALLRKLVSVRSHLYSNYGVMPKSAAVTPFEKLARYRRIDHARPNPSQAQIESQNFKMGHVDFHGIDITIENEKDSVRRGTTKEGKKWESVLTCPYGYIRSAAGGKSGERVRPKAIDGDHLDVFVGPNKASELVVVIDQHLGGKYDESKFLLGCDSQDEGVRLYRSNYQRGWPDMPASTCTFAQFKEWLKDGDHKKPFAGQMVKAASKARIFNRLRALTATTSKPVGVHSGSQIAGAAYHVTRAPQGIAKDRFIRPSAGFVPGHSSYGEQAYFQTRAPIGIDATSAGVVVPSKKLLSNPDFKVNTPHPDYPGVPAMNVGVEGGHRLGVGDLMYSPSPLRELAGSGAKWAPSKMVEFMLNNRGASKRDFLTAWGTTDKW